MPIQPQAGLAAQLFNPEPYSPIGTMQEIARVRQVRQEQAEKQKALARSEARQRALEEAGDDPTAITAILRKFDGPEKALAYETNVTKSKNEIRASEEAELKLNAAKMAEGSRMLQAYQAMDPNNPLTADIWKNVYAPALRGLAGHELAQYIPDESNPQAIQALSAAVKSGAEYDAERERSWEAYDEGKPALAYFIRQANARSPQEWNANRQAAGLYGVPKADRDMLGEFSDPEIARAKQLVQEFGVDPAQRLQAETTMMGQDIGAETTRRGQDISAATQRRGQDLSGATTGSSPADEKLADAVIKNPAIYAGLTPTAKTRIAPLLVEKGFNFQLPTADGKPSTGVEKRSLNFFNRAKDASTELEQVEDGIAGSGLLSQGWMNVAPNFLQSTQAQQYRAAQRAFTEARLRKDSGAAIPESEFDNDRRTYFVVPGDSAETVSQKRRARSSLLASLAFESGRALAEFYGDDAATMIDSYRKGAPQSGQTAGAPTGTPERGVATGLKPPANPAKDQRWKTPSGQIAVWDGTAWVIR